MTEGRVPSDDEPTPEMKGRRKNEMEDSGRGNGGGGDGRRRYGGRKAEEGK